jgi:hypothetical protein
MLPQQVPDVRLFQPLANSPWKRHPTLCHPDRSVPGFPATRNSPAATCAAFSKESRMKLANATNLHRKSGVAQWRDLLCAFPERNCSNESLLSSSRARGGIRLRMSEQERRL